MALLMEPVTHYIGAVGIDDFLPYAAITAPNTYKEAVSLPQADERVKAMKTKLKRLDEHQVADLAPAHSVSPSHCIIGTRWVFNVKADGRFKAHLVVQGWAQQHGIDCGSTFAPVCRLNLRRSIYGLRRSPNAWNFIIDKELRSLGFPPAVLDSCIYTKDSGESYFMLTLFVDDLLLTGQSKTLLIGVYNDLMDSFAITTEATSP